MGEWYNTTTVILDDRDSSIHYTGNWGIGGQFGEWKSTTTGFITPIDGSMPSFTFSFTGTAVEIVGTVGPHETPTVEFIMDGDTLHIYQQVDSSVVMFNTSYYSSPTLSPGVHTLTASITGQQPFWFDYLLYTPTNDSRLLSSTQSIPTSLASSLSSSPSPSSSPSLSSCSSLSSSVCALPSSSPSSTNEPSARSPSVGVIIGGAVGGLAWLSIMGALFLFWRRMERLQSGSGKEANHPELRPPSPFIQRYSSYTRVAISDRPQVPSLRGYDGVAPSVDPFGDEYSILEAQAQVQRRASIRSSLRSLVQSPTGEGMDFEDESGVLVGPPPSYRERQSHG